MNGRNDSRSPLLLAAVLWALIGAPHTAAQEPPTTLPSFDLEVLDGGRITSQDLAGKVALVDLWATWCVPCIKEVPAWNRLFERYGEQGFTVLGITQRSGWASDIRQDIEKIGVEFAYPVVVGDDDLEFELGVIGYPTTLLVAPDGRIVETYTGNTENKEETVEADLVRLLAEKVRHEGLFRRWLRLQGIDPSPVVSEGAKGDRP